MFQHATAETIRLTKIAENSEHKEAPSINAYHNCLTAITTHVFQLNLAEVLVAKGEYMLETFLVRLADASLFAWDTLVLTR